EGLGKRYSVGAPAARYTTFREAVGGAVRAPLARLRRNGDDESSREFWALKGVSFEVLPGEVVGVIGSNGAGKSTLLKILSRVTDPTAGRAELYGRVGSLLEVGTGFHQELTGRENIFLSGAILGMSRAEIKAKFDEIVAFAEVEKFIDTPVKRYSSGMYVRLAFAVAVHLEPEVLVIDEVLAVGDAEFQKKCLKKMQEVGRGGRTILFVSHNMAAVRNICRRGLVLERGRLVEQGEVNGVVDNYLARLMQHEPGEGAVETASFEVSGVTVSAAGGEPVIKTFDSVEIKVTGAARTDILDPGLYVSVLSLDNQRILGLDFKDFQTVPAIRAGEPFEMGFVVEGLALLPGQYQLEVWLKDMASHKIEVVPRSFPLEVVETPVYGGRKLDSWYGHMGLKASAFARHSQSANNGGAGREGGGS
ncbi:MAG TPA: ABC transporter ATP-binding protein, partial [Pyrinomonadaceae bacterium]